MFFFVNIFAFPVYSFDFSDYIQSEYGHKDSATDVQYYKFDTSGEYAVLTGGTAENHDFAYYIDASRLAEDRITSDLGGTPVDKDFVGFSLTGNSSQIGSAIYLNHSKTIGVITGDFIENKISSTSETKGTILIRDNSKIDSITGNFIGNYVFSENASAESAAILNYMNSTINYIKGDFIGNIAQTKGEAGYLDGGAIFNAGNAFIGTIEGNFVRNALVGEANGRGGALLNATSAIIQLIKGNFVENSIVARGYAYGGAIFNGSEIGQITGSFIGNHANSTQDTALGGAIFTSVDLQITADNAISAFIGNYTEDSRGKIPNAIYESGRGATLTLNSTNSGIIYFDDQIDGNSYGYNLALTGDSTSKIILNNKIINANITQQDVNTYMNSASNLSEAKSLEITSGTLNIDHFEAAALSFTKFSNTGTININALDINPATNTVGTIIAAAYGATSGSININSLNILAEPTQQSTQINFIDPQAAQSVTYSGASKVYYPIYAYDINYDPQNGNFVFNRGFNPAIYASSVAQIAGAYVNQLQTYNYAFNHVDYYMNLPKHKRIALKNHSKIALSNANSGVFSPIYSKPDEPAFWVKNYASFESIPLTGGITVNNINYGTIIGHDSQLENIKHGWQRVITAYIGYNGASQRYSGVDAYQNGGILGSTLSLYKNNFFNATTIAVGASSGDANSMYGRENYSMLTAGIANKTGYNLEFFNGKFIFQPNFLISYTFINNFDYNNAAGIKISSTPLNAIQLAPGIKIIGNTKSGWQPYIGVSVVWNIMDKSNVTANDVRIPSLGLDPYIQYGIGIQKQATENLTAYAQTMIHNGGRNGISLSFGLRWAIGKKKSQS